MAGRPSVGVGGCVCDGLWQVRDRLGKLRVRNDLDATNATQLWCTMYNQSPLSVNHRSAAPPQNIVMISCGERVEAPQASHAEQLVWLSQMTGLGWTALRDGDAILLHPVSATIMPHLRWAA